MRSGMKAKVQDKLVKMLTLVDDAYTGAGGFADGEHIFGHSREGNLAKRMLMASYTNYLKPIITARVDPAFSTEANRTYSGRYSKLIDMFLKDVDGKGTSMQDFVQDACTGGTTLDQHFIVMDSLSSKKRPLTVATAMKGRRLPYVYHMSPIDVAEYETDYLGNLKSITFKYGETAPSVLNDQPLVYKCFNDTSVSIYSEKMNPDGTTEKTVIKEVDHKLGRVPIVMYNNDEIVPFPSYYSIASQSRLIYNIESEINDLSRSQSFSMLLIPAINAGASLQNKLTVGAKNAYFYDPVQGAAPSFISPDSEIMNTQLSYLTKKEQTLIQSADILGSSAVQRGSKSESGVALGFKFFGKQQAILNQAKIAGRVDADIVALFCEMVGIKVEYSVQYEGKFTPNFDEIALRVDKLLQIYNEDLSVEANKALGGEIMQQIGSHLNWTPENIDRISATLTGVVSQKVESSINVANESDDSQSE